MTWHGKIVLYRLAALILDEKQLSSKPIIEQVQRSRTRADHRPYTDWAMNFRGCIPEQHRPALDHHYLVGEVAYHRMPKPLWKANRDLWQRVQEKGLDAEGERVREVLW